MKHELDKFESLSETSYIQAKSGRALFGAVTASGAKNMVTKVLAALLIADGGTFTVHNVPLIGEVAILLKLLEQLGVRHSLTSDKSLSIHFRNLKNYNVDFAGPIGNRISILMAGPILKHFGRAVIRKPAGCKIGQRKLDYHIGGLQTFGVEIKDDGDFLHMRVKKSGLRGVTFSLPFPSVGATENLIITAACATGESVITNCATEPEIIELIKMLQRAGVGIVINKERTIVVRSNPAVHFSDVTIIPDRVEVVSLAAAALATRGEIFIKGAVQDHIITTLGLLERMGAGIEIHQDGIRFYYKAPLQPISIRTETYPGFATDFQQPMTVLLSQIAGRSWMHETIFENRFGYLEELNKVATKNKFVIKDSCGADSPCRFAGKKFKHFAEINGPVEFGQGEVTIQDLRAGFALLIAGLLSRGLKIKSPHLLFRGYEDPVGKLKSLGADVQLIY